MAQAQNQSVVQVPLSLPKRESYFEFAPLDAAVAGLCAGFCTTVALHPLDLIKTRFQVQDANPGVYHSHGRYKNTVHAFKTIIKAEGVRGLYQGCTPNLLGSVSAWGCYFFSYSHFKTELKDNFDLTGTPQHMLAAACAGGLTLSLTNPIWVIKTRMCAQSKGAANAYTSFPNAFKSILTQEGLAGLYKGFLPGLCGVSHGMVQFVVYEKLKKWFPKIGQDQHRFDQYLFMAATSKIIATTATYPYQVVRSRIQNQRGTGANNVYSGVFDCISKIWKGERLKGFYRGLGPNILRVTPAACLTFLVYEQVSAMLKRKANNLSLL